MGNAAITDLDVVGAFPEFLVDVPRAGSGADKVVFRAKCEERLLALKILSTPVADDAEEFDPGLVTERFRREMLGMSDVVCEHIIRIADQPQLRLISGRKHVWYTEPFLSGGTLHSRLKAGPLQVDEVHALGLALLTAVDVMWNQGRFVHRDIKPLNIGYSSDGVPVLLDLGVALFADLAEITHSSLSSPGTALYAAPEQFEPRRSSNIDFRTDLFQVGIVLYESATGHHPFVGAADYYRALTNFDPAALDSCGLPPSLERLLSRLLAPHQSRRYRSPEAALTALTKDV